MAFKMSGFPSHEGTTMAKNMKDGSYKQSFENTPLEQRSTKGGEAQDQDKIFDKNGNHIGNWVNGKKVMMSTTSAHGQLNDAKREFKQDIEIASKLKPKTIAKQALTGPDKPHGQETFTKGFTSDSDYEGIVNDKKNSRSYVRKYDEMSKEDLADANIRNTGQTVIRTKDDKSKGAQKITIRKGPDKRT